jgi:hypothetical protein
MLPEMVTGKPVLAGVGVMVMLMDWARAVGVLSSRRVASRALYRSLLKATAPPSLL